MKAKFIGTCFDMTPGKVYEVDPTPDGRFELFDDREYRDCMPGNWFEVIPEKPPEVPAATTNVVQPRRLFKVGDKVRLREFAYGTTVTMGKGWGSTETIRRVLSVRDVALNHGHSTTDQMVRAEGIAPEMSCLWFDLVEDWDPTTPGPDLVAIRTFGTGATRNLDESKNDYEGFLSPTVIKAFGDYMTSHRKQKDGTTRDSDNWQKGIPIDVYMKSMFRHFMDVWTIHRGGTAISPDSGEQVDLVEALNAMLFNVQGMMHETLKERGDGK